MTIHWAIDREIVETGETDDDGEPITEIQGQGDLHVWFHDSDPAVDDPDQVVSSDQHDFEYTRRGGHMIPPLEVKQIAGWNEALEEYGAHGASERLIQILAEAAFERIERVE